MRTSWEAPPERLDGPRNEKATPAVLVHQGPWLQNHMLRKSTNAWLSSLQDTLLGFTSNLPCSLTSKHTLLLFPRMSPTHQAI